MVKMCAIQDAAPSFAGSRRARLKAGAERPARLAANALMPCRAGRRGDRAGCCAAAADFLQVDTEPEPELAARYHIRSIPILMLFRKGARRHALRLAAPAIAMRARCASVSASAAW